MSYKNLNACLEREQLHQSRRIDARWMTGSRVALPVKDGRSPA